MPKYEQEFTTIPYERERTPDRYYLHTTQAGALLPFMQASITGIILFVAVAGIGALAQIPKPTTTGLIVGLLAWVITWLILQRHWFVLTALEKMVGVDINHDGYIGEPPPLKQINVTIRDEKNNTISMSTLPATPEQLAAIANGWKNGVTFSERNWTPSNKGFSFKEFSDLKAEMLRRGFLQEINPDFPQQGVEFTPGGKALMRWFNSPIEDEG